MQAIVRTSVPRWFWIVAIAAIVWNLLGVLAFILDVTMSEDALAALPEDQRVLYEGRPTWATGAYAIAVLTGLLGSILLTMRKRLAAHVLAVSLTALLVQMFQAFVLSDMLALMGPSSAALPTMIVVIGAGFVWFSYHAKGRGWLG